MPTVIVTLEGVNLAEEYIVRELSIYYPSSKTSIHHHYDPPTNYCLDEADRKTDSYIRNRCGGVGVFTPIPGARPYTESTSDITSLGGCRIICAGGIASKWLRTILPYGDIVDIQESTKFVYPKELISTWCGFLHNNTRFCSFAKLWTLVYFLKFSGEIV